MNLFEAKLSEIATKDNAIYLEAVAKLYRVLFEGDTSNGADAQAARSRLIAAAKEFYAAADAVRKQTITDQNGKTSSVPTPLVSYVKPENENPIDVDGQQVMLWDRFEECIDDSNSLSNYELYKSLTAIAKRLKDDATITDANAFRKRISGVKLTPEQQAQFTTYLNTALPTFMDYIRSISKDKAFKRPRNGEKGVYLNNEFFNSTEAPESKPAGTKSGSAPKTPKPTKGEAKETLSTSFIDAANKEDSVPKETMGRELAIIDETMSVSEASKIVKYLNESLQEFLRAKGNHLGITANDFSFTVGDYGGMESSEEDLLADQTEDTGTDGLYLTSLYTGADAHKNYLRSIALYCLYMDARKHGVIPEPLPIFGQGVIAYDNLNGRKLLSQLANFGNVDVYNQITSIDNETLFDILSSGPSTHSKDLIERTMAAIASYFRNDLTPSQIAKFTDKSLSDGQRSQIKDQFNMQIARIVAQMGNTDTDDDAALKPAKQKSTVISDVVKLLNDTNAFYELLDSISGEDETADPTEDSDTAASGSQSGTAPKFRAKLTKAAANLDYNQLAANVIDYCRNQNKETRNRFSDDPYHFYDPFSDISTNADDNVAADELFAPDEETSDMVDDLLNSR